MNKRAKNGSPPPGHDAAGIGVSPWLRRLLSSGGIVLIAFLAFGPSLNSGVTAFDDDKIIGIFSGAPRNAADALTSNAFMEHKGQDFYRPLQSLSFMVDAAFSGQGPAGYHLTSLLLHAATACCLLQLLLLLGFPEFRSVVAASLFAAHPLFAQAVAWIPGRGDLLLGFFGVAALCGLVRYRTSGKTIWLILNCTALSCALLSKENAIVLPLLFAAYLVFFARDKAPWRNLIVPVVSWCAVCAVYLAMRNAAMSGLPGGGTFGVGPLIGNLRTLTEMLTGVFWPYDIPVMPSFSIRSTVIGVASILLMAAALAMQKKLLSRRVFFGALWYAALLLPGMMYRQLLGPQAFTYLVHRSYLPMVGIVLVLLEAVPEIRTRPMPKFVPFAAFGLVALLCPLASRQSGFFADPFAFYNQAIRTNPGSAFALNNRASLRSERGDVQGAMADIDRALRLHPDFPVALLNRGFLAVYVGDTAGACNVWRRAAALGSATAQEMVAKTCGKNSEADQTK
jgi:tetratricopeptide (TPR) repeat protein